MDASAGLELSHLQRHNTVGATHVVGEETPSIIYKEAPLPTPPPVTVSPDLTGRVSRYSVDVPTHNIFQAAKRAAFFTFTGGLLGYVFGTSIVSLLAAQKIFVFSGIFSSILSGSIIGYITSNIGKIKNTSTQEKIAAMVSAFTAALGLCLYAAMMVSLAAEIALPPLWPLLVGTIVAIPIILSMSMALGTGAGFLANKYLNKNAN